ncbi:MAG TPA: FecR family protein [Puia sp.]|nr:FecR family protein [Puia sp.]
MTKEENIRNFSEEEWEEFQPNHVLSPEISGKLWNNIRRNTASLAVRSYFSRAAVAASVLLVIGVSWYFILNKRTTSVISPATVAITKDIFNNTPQKMTLTLSDGSRVELLPNSTLSYPKNFDSIKRDVILNGEANFNIAKEVAKPFSVYSNSVLITVLGTNFTVNSFEADNATKVILHEGRVMVKIPNSAFRDSKNEYYLTPGDIFIFKKVNKRSAAVKATPIATPTIILNDSLPARVLHLERDNNDGYIFDNFPLDIVFDQLQIIYNTKIIYNKADLGNRSFIGKIDKKDSLYHILNSIALLNHFSLHKEGDSFIISN